jgi:phosphonatase-like hydrolase
MKTKLVVFDMAGTTVVDKGSVAEAFIGAFLENELEVPFEEVQQVMGYRKTEAISMLLDKFYPGLKHKEQTILAIHDKFEEKMLGFYMSVQDLKPLPFTEDIFRWLHTHNISVALNTGFTRLVTEGILYRLDWKNSNLIDAVICSDEVEEGRPTPFMINALMKKFNIEDSTEVIKVGDTEVDVLEGRNAKCGKVISVTTGAYTRSQLEQYAPDHIIDSLEQLALYIH